jgi:segregation and condensation protein A
MTDPSSEYRVELDTYSGPLDLLLYLIKREEVDIFNIPVGRVTEQYLKYMDLLSEMNINVAGEFVVMAATLIEIKSRMMTPEPEAMPEEEPDDPRMELVRQLMAYKRFKEAALMLTERAELQAERFARPGERPAGAPVHEGPAGVSIWALLDAFSKVLDQTGARRPHKLVIDNVPQEVVKAEIEARLRTAGRVSFFKVFEGRLTRARLVAMFLALLELVKQQAVRAEQAETFGDIELVYIPPEERVADTEPPPAPAETAPSEAPDTAPAGVVPESQEDEEWPEEDTGIKLPDVADIPDVPDSALPPATGAPDEGSGKDDEAAPEDDEEELDDEDEEDEFDDEDDDEDEEEDEEEEGEEDDEEEDADEEPAGDSPDTKKE